MEKSLRPNLERICKFYDQANKGYLNPLEAKALIQDFFKFYPLTKRISENKEKIRIMVKNVFNIVSEFNVKVNKIQKCVMIKTLMLLCKKLERVKSKKKKKY